MSWPVRISHLPAFVVDFNPTPFCLRFDILVASSPSSNTSTYSDFIYLMMTVPRFNEAGQFIAGDHTVKNDKSCTFGVWNNYWYGCHPIHEVLSPVIPFPKQAHAPSSQIPSSGGFWLYQLFWHLTIGSRLLNLKRGRRQTVQTFAPFSFKHSLSLIQTFHPGFLL